MESKVACYTCWIEVVKGYGILKSRSVRCRMTSWPMVRVLQNPHHLTDPDMSSIAYIIAHETSTDTMK